MVELQAYKFIKGEAKKMGGARKGDWEQSTCTQKNGVLGVILTPLGRGHCVWNGKSLVKKNQQGK